MKYIKIYEAVTKTEQIFTKAIEQNNIKKVKKILDENIIDLNKKDGIQRFYVSNVNPLWYAISLDKTGTFR